MDIDLKSRLESIFPIVRQASALALSHFGKVSPHNKPDGSVVTEADALTERLIVEGLQTRFPDETIIGEELGQSQGISNCVWSIDPIDGTAAYSSRLPFWCVSIGLLVEHQPVLGIISLPALQETYYAYQGGGAYMVSERWGKERLQIPAGEGPADLHRNSQICVPSKFSRRFYLDFIGKQRSFGSTAIHALLVARHDAAAAIMRPYQWDIAGAAAILREAGGTMAALDGTPVDIQNLLPPDSGNPDLILGTPQIIDYLRQRIHPRI
ncbi:MAG: inositol monophosphatase family protein [bacterium]|nr:inositol monophosphatase family protein [bacterium]